MAEAVREMKALMLAARPMNHLVFDIETIPDVDFGRRLLGLDGLGDADVASAMFALRRAQNGSEFLPLPQHRVVAISCALRRGDSLKVWSLGDADSGERELLERFFEGIERFTPDLVSWNGGGFDLPVMHYRCLLHGVRAARYWETGEEDSAFRYNNYLSRFHWRHLDLMDVMAGFQPRGAAVAGRCGGAAGVAGQAGFLGRRGMGSLAGRRHRWHPPLLRNGCAEHLPDVPGLRAHARPTRTRRSRLPKCTACASCWRLPANRITTNSCSNGPRRAQRVSVASPAASTR